MLPCVNGPGEAKALLMQRSEEYCTPFRHDTAYTKDGRGS